MTAIPNVIAARRLPLHAWHLEHGANLEPFAGWAMPIHYPLGVLAEHRHTRAAAGLFDVSHMGQIMLRSRTGDPDEAARALETLVPVDVLGLKAGRQRYAVFTNDAGGIRDDLMIANLGFCWYLVVNAATMQADLAHLEDRLSATCTVELAADRALLAIQGPQACAALSSLVPSVGALRFMDVAVFSIGGADAYISRSGYTGEDGFELSVPVSVVEAVAARLIEHAAVKLVGLGARDSLRLEAGLCLYGHELTPHTTPIEADLAWVIQPVRRAGGVRAGGFPGAEVILRQLAAGAPQRRVGLRSEGRPVRDGAALYADATSNNAVGRVTSGTYGPSVNGPVAMGYVQDALTPIGTKLFADIRGQRVPVTVREMPFVAHHYHR